jgi:hypothetical protein
MQQLYLLYRAGQVAGLKRLFGYIVERHATIPGVFIRTESDDRFINRILSAVHTGTDIFMKRLREWFVQVDHPMFELLTPEKMNNHVISFTNGYFDINEMKFVKWEEAETVPITDHFFDQQLNLFQIADTPTPLWDCLLEAQLGPRDKCNMCNRTPVFPDGTCEVHSDIESPGDGLEPSLTDMLEILIGRVFYPV